MRRRPASLAYVLLAGGLSACGGADQAAAPGDTTVSEAKALDEAAEMIESRPPPDPIVSPTGPLPPSATDNNSSPLG
jgi:hypothetical protein